MEKKANTTPAELHRKGKPKMIFRVPCKPYFEYDKIEHYYMKIDEMDVLNMEGEKKKTDKEKKILQLLRDFTWDRLSDSVALNGAEQLGFAKNEIAPYKFDLINEIFCERKREEIAIPCIVIYSDILVFKKDNKTIGLAKITFGCDESIIIGTSLNTRGFGQSGDYRKLFDLIR